MYSTHMSSYECKRCGGKMIMLPIEFLEFVDLDREERKKLIKQLVG